MIRRDGTLVSTGSRHVMYGKPFVDLKTSLEALKVIYDLLEEKLASIQAFIRSNVSCQVLSVKARAQRSVPVCAQIYCQLFG